MNRLDLYIEPGRNQFVAGFFVCGVTGVMLAVGLMLAMAGPL